MPALYTMDHSSRPMALYNGFDSISEPGRRIQPMFLRKTKTRRSKTAIGLSLLCVVLIYYGWKSSGIGIVRHSKQPVRITWLTEASDTHHFKIFQHALITSSSDSYSCTGASRPYRSAFTPSSADQLYRTGPAENEPIVPPPYTRLRI